MRKSEYIKWFSNTRALFMEYIGDNDIADELLHYEIFSAVWSCIKDDEKADMGEKGKEIIIALLKSLEVVDFYREELWDEFWDNSPKYQKFMEIYHLPDERLIKEAGSFWLRTVDRIDGEEDKKLRMDFSNKVIEYRLWITTYCTTFTYQYLNDNPKCGKFVVERLSILQYWEYRELENYLEKISNRSLEEQILRLTRLYCETDFDKRFPDRESLYIDLLDKGLPISESFVITNRVRKGNGITKDMRERLLDIGYSEETIVEISNIRYLKSRRNAISRFLYIKELVRKEEQINMNTIFKDNESINHRSEIKEQMRELANIVKRAEQSSDMKQTLRNLLINKLESKGEHTPNHNGCTGCLDSGRLTEKRLCRCMYYFNAGKDKACDVCKIEKKWKNIGSITVTEYEYPTKYVLDKVGGIDLIFDNTYAVEVKPQNSSETLVRMFAEILTYTTDYDYKPAICFFEGSKQMKDYETLMAEKNEDLSYLCKYIKVFYFATEQKDNIVEFEIKEIEG